jgi:hypothetical protein
MGEGTLGYKCENVGLGNNSKSIQNHYRMGEHCHRK